MFDGTAPRAVKKPARSYFKLPYFAAAAVVLLAGAAVVLALKVYGTPPVKIPSSVTKELTYPAYIPHNLPQGFEVPSSSFDYSEETLVFTATDTTGLTIAFTEQKRPKDFNFEEFYRGQIQDAERLNGTPYPSVVGKAPTGGYKLLSIVTEDTWILVTTAAPLSQDDFVGIAKGIKKY